MNRASETDLQSEGHACRPPEAHASAELLTALEHALSVARILPREQPPLDVCRDLLRSLVADPDLFADSRQRPRIQSIVAGFQDFLGERATPATPALIEAVADAALMLEDHAAAAHALAKLLDGVVSDQRAVQLSQLLAKGHGSLTGGQAEALVEVLRGSPMQLYWVAHAMRQRGDLVPARVIFDKLIDLGSAPAEAHYHLAMIVKSSDPARAAALIEQGYARDPDNAWLGIEKAKLLAKAGEAEAAIRQAAAAYAITPKLWIGIAYAQLLEDCQAYGRLSELLPALLRDHPGSADLHLSASKAAERRSDTRAAFEHAEQALRLQPYHAVVATRFLTAALAEGRAEEAEVILAEIFGSDPASFARHAVHVQARLLESADPRYLDERRIGRLLKLVDEHRDGLAPDALWDVARILQRLHRYAEAAAIIVAAMERGAGASLPPGALALASDLVGFDAAARAPAGDARSWLADELVGAGLRAKATNRSQRAHFAFQVSAALNPDDMKARINAGFCAIEAGDISKARELFGPVRRVHSRDMADVAWPRLGHVAWPRCRFDIGAAFDDLKPDAAEWPLITVITPSLNQGRYIEDTILSVLHQGYPRLQYIMVDGASSDETADVLKAYELHFDHCIVETDGGQSEAINKGLALARGDIVSWINADDVLAPGALHMVALAWLKSDADLVYGICMTHTDHRFEMANLPQAEASMFSVEHLSDIFAYWRKGYFFYQPEVFFTRRILERAGASFDTGLHFTMDYDFWLRCARAGASFAPVHWPIAFFRHHDEQKTADALSCVLEQVKVRNRYATVEPDAERRRSIGRRLGAALAKRPVTVELVSSRLSKIFSPRMAEDLAASFAGSRFAPRLVHASEPGAERDLVVRLVHIQNDAATVRWLRQSGFDGPIVGWFWDNHHHLQLNYETAEAVDVVVPGHAFAEAYLANRQAVQAEPLALCVTQWSASEAERFFLANASVSRSDALYGGFVRYGFSRRRNAFIERLHEAGFDRLTLLEDGLFRSYFGRPAEARFADWMAHKTSLCLPLERDLSQRLFDALLTGQVPVVAADIDDLDRVIPPHLQASLPIIRFERYEVPDVRQAHARALAAFDADGYEGALRRHRYALEHHTFEARVRQLLARLSDLVDIASR